ncbi:type I restriction-modification system subunit M N-terminal domain-containing protein [Pseudomonas aeruginosa]|nr:type I restriction-modification system subunit M N-terminal domain-containing protein [Pseudomonas aeruginosa]ERU90907.1 hypothetical protein Q081_05196 [Pseudomonas aeruginosa M8A.2]ERX89737.1 hypothetical protein Q082_03730 [Pseudomonas aeruginosa M8A.3]ARN43506.1 hypothetical protein A6747_26475 [Pseudomonas aeruginosa]AXL68548.1 hypothetical protein Y31_0580 [Pseudomonas aeruginosa]EKW4491141.1 type I restriction-modification system subunit M N-terminal domain-containing protein [Pseudo
MNQQNLADFIWSVADVLRGDFKQPIYGRIILPFTPRDVVRLTTTLEFPPDHQALNGEDVVRTVYDCAAGTGQIDLRETV